MRLGLLQMRRSIRRTIALVASVAILTALTLFVTTLSGTLEQSLSGAIINMDADLVVLTSASRGTPQASRITTEQLDGLRRLADIERLAPIGELRVTAVAAGREVDASLFGVPPDGPGQPTLLVDGRRPSAPGEMLIDESELRGGLALGDRVEILGTDVELTVVGVSQGSRFGGILTLHSTYDDWLAAFGQLFPDATELRPTMVALSVPADVELSTLLERIDLEVDGIAARTPVDLATELPGITGIRDSFRLISAVAVGAALLLIGSFWSLVASQQARHLAVLHAIGVARRDLVRALVTQVVAVVAIGALLGVVTVGVVGAAAPPTFPLAPSPTLVAVYVPVLLVGALLAALPAVSRVTRVDPMRAIAEADR